MLFVFGEQNCNSLCKWICCTCGSGVDAIQRRIAEPNAIIANRSRVCRGGRALRSDSFSSSRGRARVS